MNKNMKIGIAVATIIILIIAAISFTSMQKNHKYTDMLTKATTELDAGNYTPARHIYEESLGIKNNPMVNEKLDQIFIVENVQAKLQGAKALIADNKLTEAKTVLANAPTTISNQINIDVKNLKDSINIKESSK